MADKKYMTLDDVKLKQPLTEVKRSQSGNTTLIIPANIRHDIIKFFDNENVDYELIEEPVLYPQEKLDAGIERYEATSPGDFEDEEPVLLITQFDVDSLFEWTQQLYGKTIDKSYEKYLDDRSEKADEYYRTQYEFRPD